MSDEPRVLSPATAKKLLHGIRTHASLMEIARGQDAEQIEREKDLDEDGQTILSELVAILRATRDNQAATHLAVLTQIACTLALLEAQGYDVEPFHTLTGPADAGGKVH